MSWKDTMRRVAARTAPDADQVRRVRSSLDAGLQSAQPLLRDLPGSTPMMEARVRARLREPRRGRSVGWVGVPALLAAGAAFALWIAPEPQPTTATIARGASALGDIAVDSDGIGNATGGGRDWQIDWERGRLALEVPADGAHTVEIHTPEAVVRVVGTGFSVDRDALGTHVAVAHGRVEVRCAIRDGATLTAGQAHTCWPATAAGLLGRGRELSERAATPDAVLAALDLGLGLEGTDAIRAELQVGRIAPLLAQGNEAEALTAAEAALDIGGPRAAELRRTAAALALRVGGCNRAVPHLRAIAAPTPEEAETLDVCTK